MAGILAAKFPKTLGEQTKKDRDKVFGAAEVKEEGKTYLWGRHIEIKYDARDGIKAGDGPFMSAAEYRFLAKQWKKRFKEVK